MAIPTIPGTEQINTPSAGVKLNYNALNVTNQTKMAMGEAVGYVGEQVGAFSQKLQAAKNYGIAADASREMQKSWGEFVQSRQGRDDEENWVNEWQQKAQEVKGSVYEKHAPGPQLKRQLEQNFKDWEVTNTIETKTIANKKAIGTANLRVDAAINEAAQTGHPEAAEPQIRTLIDGKVKAGLIAPQRAKAELQDALNKVDEYAARNYIEANPIGASKYLEDKKNLSRLDPNQRDRFLTESRVRRHQAQSDQVQGIRDSYDSGAPKSEAQIDDMVKTEQISPRGAEMYRAYAKGDTLKKSKDNFDLLNAEILSSDVSTMKPDERAAWKAQISEDTIGLQQVHRNMITRAVDAKMKAVDSKDEKTENKVKYQTIAQMHRDFSEGYVLPGEKVTTETPIEGTGIFGSNWFRKKKTEDKVVPADASVRRGWMNNADLDTLNSTKVRFAKELGKMDDFFSQHAKDNDGKGPSYEEAEAFRQKLMEPYLAESVSKALTAPIAAPTKSKYEVGKKYKDAKGNVATWNGTSWE